MSKGLEALAKIRFVEVQIGNDPYTAIGVFDINNDYNEHFRIIKKELTALEIIKEKIVLLDIFLLSKDVNDYNDIISKNKNRHLAKEEYEVLKEILL